MNNQEFKRRLNDIKCALIDLDGTLYIGDRLISGADIAVKELRKRGVSIVFLTNNSSKTADEYVIKLKRMGLYSAEDIVYTSANALSDYLILNGITDDIFMLGTKKVKNEILARGINVSDSGKAVAVLAYDKEINYNKICKFNELLASGAKYIATHADKVCPGVQAALPDAGSFIKIFECSINRLPDVIIGKPQAFMGELILNKFNLKHDNVLMIGDRLYTDIQFGITCKFLTALVLSGETTKEMLDNSTLPYAVFKNILELVNSFGV